MTRAAAAQLAVSPVFSAGAAASGLAVAVGVGLAADVRLGAGLALAALAVTVALRDLPLVIAAWAGLAVFARDPALGRAATATGLLAVAAWVAHMRARPGSIRAALHPHRALLTVIGLLLTWLTLSTAWSRDVATATSALPYWCVNAAAMVVLLTSLRTPRDVRLVIGGFVVAVVAAVGLGLLGVELSLAASAVDGPEVDGRLAGVVGDPNVFAALIVPAIVLSVVLRNGASRTARTALLPVPILLVVGLAATGSRGGIVAAVAAFVGAVLLMRGRRLAALGTGVVVLAVAAAWISSDPAMLERLRTAAEDRGSGRSELWLVAGRMTEEYPVGGVGLANFTVRSREYALRPGGLEYAEFLADRPLVAHNTYLEMLAETGVVGFSLFVALIGVAVTSAIRAARRFERAGARGLALVARGVAVADIGVLVAASFISVQTMVALWVLLALGPVLFGVACSREGGAVSPDAARAQFLRRRGQVVAGRP